MERLIYDSETKKIIERIADCEGTITGTPFEVAEGTAEQIDALIVNKGLSAD